MLKKEFLFFPPKSPFLVTTIQKRPFLVTRMSAAISYFQNRKKLLWNWKHILMGIANHITNGYGAAVYNFDWTFFHNFCTERSTFLIWGLQSITNKWTDLWFEKCLVQHAKRWTYILILGYMLELGGGSNVGPGVRRSFWRAIFYNSK